MGLRDRLSRQNGNIHGADIESRRFQSYGVVDNPFPSASQTQGHPHLETDADDKIARVVGSYDQDISSQVLVIEGDQGTGKTNLLNYYEQQFKELYPVNEGFYIIRYYADPEPGFDKMLARILQELGVGLVKKLAEALSDLDEAKREEVVDAAKMSDMRIVLSGLSKAGTGSDNELAEAAEAAIEWILGSRVLKRHRDRLGQIRFRLDTVESKTQALRDLVFCSAKLNVLKGIILLLDELEKADATTSKLVVLRFLSAIRALIDALPKYLFLMAAITPEARRRYFEMLPAFAGRLQNKIELTHLKDPEVALQLYRFYLKDAQSRAASKQGKKAPTAAKAIVSEDAAVDAFSHALEAAQTRGDEGVRQRDYLNALHLLAAGCLR